jgi:hypothetical protein
VNTAPAFAPRITPHVRTVTLQASAPAVAPQTVAAVNPPAVAQNDAPIFRGLFQNDTGAPISQDVRSLWGGVNPFLRRT